MASDTLGSVKVAEKQVTFPLSSGPLRQGAPEEETLGLGDGDGPSSKPHTKPLPWLLLSQISVPRLLPGRVASPCSRHRLFCFLANRGGIREERPRVLTGT